MTPEYRDTALLFSRAGFGGLHSEIVKYQNMPWVDKVDMVLDLSRAPAISDGLNLSSGRGWWDRYVDMVAHWTERARRPVDRAPIQEKMTLFWHGHLVSGLEKTGDHRAMFDQIQLFRRHGMGNFQNLLWRTSVGPAMLSYLDNDRNVAGAVNENFGRELLELFTLGVGQYTEADVRASARAWTGHGLDTAKRYRFYADRHDGGSKTFLGRTGAWNGDDIIRLIVTEKRNVHARFLCAKLWSFFAYPVRTDDPVIADIAAVYSRALDIKAAVRAIFLHPRFRSDQTRQGLVRSPFEYLVAAARHTRLPTAEAHPEWYLGPMGQSLYDPPNVSGWGQNEYWISESATWAKARMARHYRWKTYERGDLSQVTEVTSWNPVTYRISPEQAVDSAMINYNMRLTSPATRAALVDYVKTDRASDSAWGHRAGLLMLPLMTPEFQLA